MKKQTLIIILLTILVVSCLALTACHSCEFGEWTVVKQATCTEMGQLERSCACGEKETSTLPTTGHTFGEWTVVEDATCTEIGQEQRVCSCGEKETRDIQLADHSFDEWAVVSNATCTEAGLKVGVCECGESKSEIIPATGHSHEAVVTAPSCTEQGYTTRACHCGDSFVDTYVDALGHTEGSVVVENNVEPDCVSDGSYDNVVYCTVCKVELSRDTVVVLALGHTEGSVVVENNVAPKCTVDGSYDNVVYCSVCKEELGRETKIVDATGHSYKAVVTDPNCIRQGYTTHTCIVCWDSYIDTYTPKGGHDTNGQNGACSGCGIIYISLRELCTNTEQYKECRIAFEGVVTLNSEQVVYVEDYDEETGTHYGIDVYYGFGLPSEALEILEVGNRVRIVGVVQY